MMVKDDYESFCSVADRAANVKFQELLLFFPQTPEPLAEDYFVTIQVRMPCDPCIINSLITFQIGDQEEIGVMPRSLTTGSLVIKFPEVIDMQCSSKEGNINVKLWCSRINDKTKTMLLSSSSFPLKLIAIGSHDKQILLKGRVTATLSCRIVGEAANQVESQSVMQSRARYEAFNKSKFALIKQLLLDDGGLLLTQFISTLDVR
jgi:hypothetical protein